MTLCDVIEIFVVLSVVLPCPSMIEAQNVTSQSLFRHVIDFTSLANLGKLSTSSVPNEFGFS